MTSRRSGTGMLDEYADGIDAGWSADELYRLIVKNVSRRFHNTGEDERQLLLQTAPRLTGTAWDALMAAVIEHLAETHGYTRPAWVDQAERFADEPAYMLPKYLTQGEALRCPAAFLRHGTFIDPRSLDRRNGEENEW